MGASKKESDEVDKKEEKNRKKNQHTKKEKLSTEESLLHKKQEDTATDYKVFSEDDASEDYKSVEKSEAGDSESSGDEGFHNTGSNEGLANEGQREDSEPDQGGEESDSSEDEVAPRNTVGDVPLEWYRDEKHIGYDIAGKKLKKKERQDKLDSFLANVDNSKNWRKIYDEYNDEDVELTKEETKLIRRMLKGKAPHGDFDLYAPYVDWFKWEDSKHPLSNAPEPKSRFIPSKWEAKKVLGLVRAIRKGLIKFDKPKEEPRFYMLWGDDASSSEKTGHLSYIPAPKPNLPGVLDCKFHPRQPWLFTAGADSLIKLYCH